MDRVKNKVAIVTGAASVPGIGSATAIRLAEEGAVVYAADLDAEGAEKLARSIRNAGHRAFALALDVSCEDDWSRAMGAVIREQGQLDIMVNNAGIFASGPVNRMDLATWDRVQSVNLTGVFLGTRSAVAAMKEAGGGGSIINVSSTAGLFGIPMCSAYAASKGGVRMFSKAVAMEVARNNIRVNTIHPGPIDTNLTVQQGRNNMLSLEESVKQIPLGRRGKPDDIAWMTVFLASDESSFITGAEMVVDGGQNAQ